jgi:hypothetical protein
LRFSNARLDGWAMDVARGPPNRSSIFPLTVLEGSGAIVSHDPAGLTSIFIMFFKDGSDMSVSEIVSLSPDGKSRSRATQYLVGGKVVRRTLIDEVKMEP